MLYRKAGKVVSLEKNLNKVVFVTLENYRVANDAWLAWYRFKSTVNKSPWIQYLLKHGKKEENTSYGTGANFGKDVKVLGIRVAHKNYKNLGKSFKIFDETWSYDIFDYTLEGMALNLEGYGY
jgi:hypothetical protein